MDINTLADKFWSLYINGINFFKNREELDGVVLFNNDPEAMNRFKANFVELYNFIFDKFMKKESKDLDRHKTAAICAISISQSKLVVPANIISEEEVFVGDWTIAINVALTYLLSQLNVELTKVQSKTVERLYMPPVFTCERLYPEVAGRHLYFNKQDGGRVSPLDLAEKFYLLECITLERNGIPCETLIYRH